eukprot:TRINITY_DN1978_c1_g7_i1.p1 TRINITY_DN1978_c1_g7~~TRINITY_DN1978_c1_g7_i1.p1  ORF type:complete len:456 (+),score=111.68 TRINITY_DN1978_c1_g7_i1:61-1368(+)
MTSESPSNPSNDGNATEEAAHRPSATEEASHRPSAHVGLREGQLPALRPMVGARTPLEALTRPPAESTDISTASPAGNRSSGGGGYGGAASGTTSNRCAAAGGDGGSGGDATAATTAATTAAATSDGGSGDVLEQLRKHQLAEQKATTDQRRHWGENERLVRDLMEDLSQGIDDPDKREDLNESLKVAEPFAVDGDGFGLIHYASMYGDVDAVSSLIKRKSNVNSRTKVHETPLMLAAYYRHPEVCAVLLAHRARSDLADWQGRTPLEAAKVSKCIGSYASNPGLGAQQQARCVKLLDEVAAKQQADGPPSQLLELKKQGNDFFKDGRHNDAIAAYSLGLSYLDDAGLYANRAACYLHLGKHMEAKMDSKKAVGLSSESGHLKASWRLVKCCLALGELDAAEEALKEALAKFPGDAALRQLGNEISLEKRKRLGK